MCNSQGFIASILENKLSSPFPGLPNPGFILLAFLSLTGFHLTGFSESYWVSSYWLFWVLLGFVLLAFLSLTGFCLTGTSIRKNSHSDIETYWEIHLNGWPHAFLMGTLLEHGAELLSQCAILRASSSIWNIFGNQMRSNFPWYMKWKKLSFSMDIEAVTFLMGALLEYGAEALSQCASLKVWMWI